MTNFSVDDLVPHSGLMSLLDRIVDYGDDWLEAQVDISDNSLFLEAQGMPALVGLEYLAQTIAAFSGVEEQLKGGSPKLGFLLGTRKFVCSTDYFQLGQTITLKVQREMKAENGLHVFQCVLSGKGLSATATINVFQPEDANTFIKEAKA